MTVESVLVGLRSRSVELFAVNGTLRVRPRGSLTPDEQAAVVTYKAELLRALELQPVRVDLVDVHVDAEHARCSERERAQLVAEAAAGGALAQAVLDALWEAPAAVPAPVSGPGAVLLHSRRLGCEVWVLREPADLDLIRDEVGDRPVFLADELPLLGDLDDAALRAVCDAKVAIPGTRVVTDSGERLTPARAVFPSPAGASTR